MDASLHPDVEETEAFIYEDGETRWDEAFLQSEDLLEKLADRALALQMPKGLTPDQRKKLENAALTCPVHKSLHPDVEKPVTFVYEDGEGTSVAYTLRNWPFHKTIKMVAASRAQPAGRARQAR